MRSRMVPAAARVLLAAAVAALVLVVAPLVLRRGAPEAGAAPVASLSAAAGLTAPAVDGAELDRLIALFSERAPIRNESLEYRTLGRHLLTRAQMAGDLSDFVAADAAFAAALDLHPDDRISAAGRARVALSLHDFVRARDLAVAVIAADPAALDAVAIAGDAALALGNVAAAGDYYDRLEAASGDPAVVVRRAQLAFESGDLAAALSAADGAVQAAAGVGLEGRPLAFYQTYAARLAQEVGDLERAVAYIEAAHEQAPSAPGTLAELARVAAATGDFSAAIEAYEAASAIVPDPVTLAALGDLYALTGDAAAAEDRYATVGAIATLAGANRQAYNRAYAQFLADHDRDVALALSLAEQELEVRKDPVGYDAYAWALYRNGRFPEARAASETALAAGGRRAVMLYHAGMISAALGDADRALAELQEAMALNAGFDPLQARTAAEAIEALT